MERSSDDKSCSHGYGKYCVYYLDLDQQPGTQKKVKLCEERNTYQEIQPTSYNAITEEEEEVKMDLD